jgi:hypothetical protein
VDVKVIPHSSYTIVLEDNDDVDREAEAVDADH